MRHTHPLHTHSLTHSLTHTLTLFTHTHSHPPHTLHSHTHSVYDDPTPGAKAPVTLLPGYSSYHLWVEGRGREGDGEEGEGTVVLGTVSIAPEISWITMDTKICDIFMVSKLVLRVGK